MTCNSALILAGQHYWCDGKGTDHGGWPHANAEAKAVWGDPV